MKNINIQNKFYIIGVISIIGTFLIGLFIHNQFNQLSSSGVDIDNIHTIVNFSFFLLVTINIVLVFILSKQINSAVKSLSLGLDHFFRFLKHEEKQYKPIEYLNNDEFGNIAKLINTNAKNLEQMIDEDNIVLAEIEDVVEKIDNGFFMYQIKATTSNHQIESLKEHINHLAKNINNNLTQITHALMEYGESNFEYSVSEDKNMNGSFGSLKAGTRLIRNNVSEILAMIMNSGQKLNFDTDKLSSIANHLSKASNEQAASLEETAAALEEITSAISNNASDVQEMNSLTKDLTVSVKEGENFAGQTQNAMDEIDAQVKAINEAISIIDQISFQTNILSLNAAVEAATAGEAGKGFAVVAGEVRNLASRSAEAANEIKSLVESASEKTNYGKNISGQMIQGYGVLNDKISQTIGLIENVASASREQESGIRQINDAVSQLDKATQQNAVQANEMSGLSNEISALSSNLVEAASRAKFPQDKKEQVCDVDLVYTTAKLKNDHIRFKENNFSKLGNNITWDVVTHHDCALGKWIDQSENDDLDFTKTKNWEQLKEVHKNVHQGVQSYIKNDANKELNSVLQEIATQIEDSTNAVFDTLNHVKVDHCKE